MDKKEQKKANSSEPDQKPFVRPFVQFPAPGSWYLQLPFTSETWRREMWPLSSHFNNDFVGIDLVDECLD